MQKPKDARPAAGEYDVFVCCPDPARVEAGETLVAYLSRAGFRVFFQPGIGEPGEPRRIAVAESASDFVLFLPSAGGQGDAADGRWQAEVAAALASGRNIVRVSMPGDAAGSRIETLPGLERLAGQQAAVYDPDRLAESLSVIQHCLSTDSIVIDRHEMRRTRRWFQFAGLLVLAGFLAQTIPILYREWKKPKAPPPVAPLVLYWAAFGERDVAGHPEEFPLVTGASVKTGDRLRVALSTSANGFAYVIARDTRGRVSVLFPTERLKGASRVRAGKSYAAPFEGGWLTVDGETGIEMLYVFASYDPLQNLEELIEEPETGTDVVSRRALVEQTVNGLLDGKHYPAGPRVWIRSLAPVDSNLKPAPGPESFSAKSSGGQALTHPAIVQPGLVNALAEIKLTFAR